ncbi:MAG: hypothetical protein A2068_07995 [Ignavibacteria bacterium GWB2_35_6b]|nr:MAG: hypothetical protein A2068_07995 [Ignavibacteria bacterium GWB2_35_6b]
MDNKKLELLLNKAKPETEINSEHKRNLRRELLNSKNFSKKPFFKNKFVYASALSLIILLIFILPFDSNIHQIKAEDVINRLETVYAGYSLPDKLNTFNGGLKIFGTKQDDINFKIKRVIDFENNRYRLKLISNTDEEILDDYIIENGNVYRTASPKIETINTFFQTDYSKLKFNFDNNFIQHDSSVKGIKIYKFQTKLDEAAEEPSYIVYRNNSLTGSDINNKLSEQKFEVPKEMNLQEYLKINPVDIVGKIRTKENNFVKQYFDHVLNEEIFVLESISDFSMHDNMIFISSEEINDSDTMYFNKTVTKEYNLDLHGDKDSNGHTITFADSLLKSHLKKRNIKKIETIKIEASSGRIVQMNISIRKDGRERLLSEITFEGENNISPSPKIFDYKTTGFVFSHKIKE